jgi:hypothetical protein
MISKEAIVGIIATGLIGASTWVVINEAKEEPAPMPPAGSVQTIGAMGQPVVEQTPGFKTKVPAGARVMLPKDGIPAIWEPEFVPASEAGIPDDHMMIGVVINGEAHAYSMEILDRHEIVNDVVGGRKVITTW